MFRGMELILRGRDPRDAWLFAQRVCGACTDVHALASVRAVENALGVTIPRNARLIRNLIAGAQYAHGPRRPLLPPARARLGRRASPRCGRIRPRPRARPLDRATGRSRARPTSRTSGTGSRRSCRPASAGPFANGYWGHPAYRLPPEANLLVVAHYLEALDWQRQFSRIHVLLGGKNPHPQTFLVGGMAAGPPWGGPAQTRPGEHPRGRPERADRPERRRAWPTSPASSPRPGRSSTRSTSRTSLAIAGDYPDWAAIGAGHRQLPLVRRVPGGRRGRRPRCSCRAAGSWAATLGPVEPVDQAGVAETVAHSWYTYDDGDDGVLRTPATARRSRATAGRRRPSPRSRAPTSTAGSRRPATTTSRWRSGRWRGCSSPTWRAGATCEPLVERAIGRARPGPGGACSARSAGSSPGRSRRRWSPASWSGWLDGARGTTSPTATSRSPTSRSGIPRRWPGEATGLVARRGAARAPSATGSGSRDQPDRRPTRSSTPAPGTARRATPSGRRGAWEEALVGTPVADPARPLEILRTVHSFDPCTACAVHALGPAPVAGRDPGRLRRCTMTAIPEPLPRSSRRRRPSRRGRPAGRPEARGGTRPTRGRRAGPPLRLAGPGPGHPLGDGRLHRRPERHRRLHRRPVPHPAGRLGHDARSA